MEAIGDSALLGMVTVMPPLLLLWFFQLRDRYPEPPRVIWMSFALGALLVLLITALGQLFEIGASTPTSIPDAVIQAFIQVALPEELLKLLVFLLYCQRHRAFDEKMDGPVYAVAVAMGFAALENAVYVMHGDMETAWARAFTAVPAHALCGAVMGYRIVSLEGPPHSLRVFLGALIPAVLIHGIYDSAVFTLAFGASDAHGIIRISAVMSLLFLVLFGWVWVMGKVQRLRNAQSSRTDAIAISTHIATWVVLLLGAGTIILGGSLCLSALELLLFESRGVQERSLTGTIGVVCLVIGFWGFHHGSKRLNGV